jgi:hypothetical protein
VTDEERVSLSVKTIEFAQLSATLRRAGLEFEADRLAIRVAENAERLAQT